MAQSFIIPPKGQIDRRRRLADVLAQEGTSTAPVQSWTQGAARLAQSLAGAFGNYQANQMDQQRQSALAQALQGGGDIGSLAVQADDPMMMQLAQLRAIQEQRKAEAVHQASQDAQHQSNWQASHDQSNQFHQADDARADAAARSADERYANRPPEHSTTTDQFGNQVINERRPDGSWVQVSPEGSNAAAANPSAAPKPPKMTEGEQKSFRFYKRARNANEQIGSEEEAALGSGVQDAAAAIPLVGNYAVSKPRQKGNAAAVNFLGALGYSDSGAQINRDEYARNYAQYIPQRGDGPDVIAQKKHAREEALAALKGSTGRASAVLDAEDNAYAEAKDAIAKGADPAAIKQRLKDNGFDTGNF